MQNKKTIKYIVPIGSVIHRKFHCPIIKKEISLKEDFTEEEMVFNSVNLSSVDSGVNFSIFRFNENNINYSVDAQYIDILKGDE